MEEKSREVGSPSPSPSPSATISSSKNVDSPATEPPPPRRRGQKRKSTTSNSFSAPPKRHAREKAAAAAAAASGGLFSLLPPIHNGPLTRARQLSDNNAAIFSALNAVKNDHSMASVNDSAASEGREEVKAVNEEHKKIEAQIDAEVLAIRTRDSNVHVVPVAAGWFSWTNIHSIEKQMMHSFFNGKTESRTPDIYKEIRNWIMKRFHANPSTNIELNDLSELSIGDIDARQEIMEFLDHWGLINYHPFPQDDSANVDADPNTDDEKENKTDSLIEKLFQFESAQSSPELVPRANMSAVTVPSGLFPESIAEELVKQEGPAVEYHCNSCSADCSRKRYHCQKQADFDLCSECYNNGKFGSGMCPSDFILMEPADVSGATGGKWTDQETLLLLEALELYKENWNEIAEHVATKTKAQCILHFLQMPIEDSFLDCDDTKDSALRNGEQPTSTNIELPVSKDNSEPSEGGISKDNSGPAEIGSGKDSSELSASKSSKENPDLLEKKTESNAAQPVSTQTETSNLEDAPEGKAVEGQGDEIIIKALKEAFRVAGCPLTPEDNLSFAEAGNSVMALTAFLNQLVEPGLATVSARSSLKAISESYPNSQLAISHCFILEDPHDDEKEYVISESMTTEKVDQNAPEMAKDELIIDKKIINTKEKSTSLIDGSHSTEGQIPKEEDANTKDDSQVPLGEQDKCSAGLPERPDEEMVQVSEKPDEKSQLKEKPDEQIPQVTEKPDEERPQFTEKPDEEKSSVTEKSGEDKSLVTENSGEDKSLTTEKPNEEKFLISEKPDEEKSQVPEKTNKEKLTVTGKHSEINNVEQVGTKPVNEPQNCSFQNEQSQITAKDQITSESELMPPPALASESGDLKTSAEIQCMEATKNTVMDSSCAVSDKTEQQVMAGAVPMVEAASEAGEDKMEVDKIGDTKSTKTAQMKDEDNVTKLKRAALATLSAAAVKSKLLANQEEDEIRQLATILIEKQMRKLEVKLSYFTEMESAIMRVRDQLERSRQRLFSERAQIIASRLGIQPSSSRMLPSSYPVNRMPPGLLNSIRPPMNMVAQRPLMSKPNVTSAPPTSTSAPPEVAGGSPTQSSAIEKPSSVGQTESLK